MVLWEAQILSFSFTAQYVFLSNSRRKKENRKIVKSNFSRGLNGWGLFTAFSRTQKTQSTSFNTGWNCEGGIMKYEFESLHLNKTSIGKLKIINSVIEDYQKQGYKLTLRQLYYQLVSRNIIANIDAEYGALSRLLTKGRMGGVIDWDAIEDRLRQPYIPYWVENIPDAINDTVRAYRLNRQEGQKNYIEVWCEKDAISNVLKRITQYYHIYLMVNRGYSSCSAMYDSYNRIEYHTKQNLHILYCGDHDPSGLDMIRDITERLMRFGLSDIDIKHVAITKEQIKEYNPPPNPAKLSDTRATNYIAKYGNVSWEVDALRPDILHRIITDNIKELVDINLFSKMIRKEEEDKKELANFSESYKK